MEKCSMWAIEFSGHCDNVVSNLFIVSIFGLLPGHIHQLLYFISTFYICFSYKPVPAIPFPSVKKIHNPGFKRLISLSMFITFVYLATAS